MGKETIDRSLKLKIELQSAFNGRKHVVAFMGSPRLMDTPPQPTGDLYHTVIPL